MAVLLSATESWAIRQQYSPAGILATDVVRQVGETRPVSRRRVSRGNAVRVDTPTLLLIEIALCALVTVISFLCLLRVGHGKILLVLWVAIVFAAIINLAVGSRTPAGQDGADQMASIVLVVCGIGLTPGLKGFLAEAAVWFIALQACLAYTTAGVAKILSDDWRSGDAARLVFRTSS
jgi:hypothetical protein